MQLPLWLWFLSLEGHESPPLLRTSRDTRYAEVEYPPEYTRLVAAHFETPLVSGWLQSDLRKPPFLAFDDEITEVPLIIANDNYYAAHDKDPGIGPAEPGPRIVYNIQHPATLQMDDPMEVQAAESAFEGCKRAKTSANGGEPCYDPRRASIWCLAAPGVKITKPNEGTIGNAPKISVVRVQDNRLLPAAGEKFELGKYVRTTVWMLVRGIIRYEVLTNPSPEEVAQFREPVSQIIEARERPDGVDFIIRTGTSRSAFGFKASVTVDPESDKDRFWYGIEQEGNGPMRLRVVASSNVPVRLSQLTYGEDAPASWPKFWSDFAYSTYQAAERVANPQISGPSDGHSGGQRFYDWVKDTLTVGFTTVRIPFAGAQHLLYKLSHAIGEVGDNHQVRQLASPFFALERYSAENAVHNIPAPSLARSGMNASDKAHPLFAISNKLETGSYAMDGAAGTIVAGVTDLPQPLAEMASAVLIGGVPLVGDAFDLIDAADLVFNGNAPDGTEPGAMDYLGLGVFALVSGASVYSGLKKTLTGTRRSADYAAIVRRLEDEARIKLRELDDIAETVRSGGKLDEGAIRKLTRLLTDLNLDDAVPGMRPGYVLDDLVGDTGFKHPWLETLYRKANAEDADALGDVASARKKWLRSLPEDNDLRRLITASLGEKLAKIEFLAPPPFDKHSRLASALYRKAVDDYVALHRAISKERLDAVKSLDQLGSDELQELARHHGPYGMGLEFDYDRFPIENLEAVAADIADEFLPGMPVNWPLDRKVYIGSTQGEVIYRGLEVPGYRGAAAIEQSASRVGYETSRAVFRSNQSVKWRIDGNLLFFEKVKRKLDPERKQFLRSKRDYTLPKGYDPADPAASDWNAIEKEINRGGWYKAVEDPYNPIAEIPDDMLQFQLHRHEFSPPSGRASGLPPKVELDHEFIPQRVFYELGMRGLVRDEVLKDMTRSVIPADEIDDWLKRMDSPEYKRAIRLKNQLNAQLGQTSGRRLIAKHRTVHSEKDAYAISGAVSHVMARLDDETYFRDMAHVPIDTLRLLAREVDDAKSGAIAPYLRWTINQEFSSRNLMIDDLPGAKIPRDFRKPLDEYLAAIENGMEPDPPITGYRGRQLPTAEDHQRYIRMGRYKPTEYKPTY